MCVVEVRKCLLQLGYVLLDCLGVVDFEALKRMFGLPDVGVGGAVNMALYHATPSLSSSVWFTRYRRSL